MADRHLPCVRRFSSGRAIRAIEDFCAKNAAWPRTSRCSWRSSTLAASAPGPIGSRTCAPRACRARRARRRWASKCAARVRAVLLRRQWQSLRDRCRSLGWPDRRHPHLRRTRQRRRVGTHPDLFCLDGKGSHGRRRRSSILLQRPPPAAGATRLYHWEKIEDGVAGACQRFAHAFARFDAVRLDHFIGFTRYWEVPAQEPTAEHGRWRPGPGAKLFQALGRRS